MIVSNFNPEGRFASKKALREHVVFAGAENVFVTDTSAFNNRGSIPISELTSSDVIVGPDAYTDRRWYANAKRNAKTGTIAIV